MDRRVGTKEESVCISQGPRQKETGSKIGTSWGSLEIPTIWTVSILWGQGCLTGVVLSTKNVAPVSGLEEMHPQSREMFLQAD